MSIRLQLAAGLLVLGLGTLMAVPSSAQRPAPHFSPPPQHKPPKPAQPRADRPPQHQEKKAGQQGKQGNGSAGNPGSNPNHAGSTAPSGNNPNRPPSAYTPPPAPPKKFNDLSPQDKQKVLENNRRLQNLPPAQRLELQERAQTWNRLTPAQRDHIKNDVLPRWKTMPVERRQAIRQRLQILQNMPESAKNQRLNDPNFTRGMSEEDKSTLRDLTHMHIGAPDPPGE